MYDTLIKAVREIDPDKIIHIEPIWGNSDMRPSCVDWSKLTVRTNVALHVHDYFAGGDDDGFSSSCGPAGTHVWDGSTGYANLAGYQAQMDAHILTYKNAALTGAGIPLFVGEYGIGQNATNHDVWIQ